MQEFKFKKVFNSIGIRGDNVYISFFNEDGVTLFEYHGGHIPKAKTFSPTKAQGKLFLHNYGITPKALVNIIKGVVMEKVISPHPHWDKLTYSRRNWTKPWHEVQLIEMEDV